MSEIPRPPAAADSEAVPVLGLQKKLGAEPTKRSTVLSWALWDWGLQPFNTIIVTFIFTALYRRPTPSCPRRSRRSPTRIP
jgi:UMF1 family MFS transporter